MIRSLAAALASATLAACATAPAGDDPAAYPAALAGRYDNAAQYAAAPEDLKRPPVADDSYEWLDLQTATFAVLPPSAIGPNVLYVEWRGADGAISRQRIWTFRRDSAGDVRMDFYTIVRPERFAGGAPDAFGALGPADLVGYGPACGLLVSRVGPSAWDARIDPQTCRITAQSGRVMGIDARITVMATGVLYQEAGVLEDGRFAFRVPGGTPYDFRRTP